MLNDENEIGKVIGFGRKPEAHGVYDMRNETDRSRFFDGAVFHTFLFLSGFVAGAATWFLFLT